MTPEQWTRVKVWLTAAFHAPASDRAALLDRAVNWLKPGGTLFYATCSLEPEEGEAQIESLLARHPHMQPRAIDQASLPAGLLPDAHRLRILPGLLADAGGLDGFFIASLSRSESV